MTGRGTVLGGRYTLTGRIGGGGMGAVWRAEDSVLGRPVAVKILHPALLADVTFAERFRREARLLALLDHQGIVDVHDYGEEEPPDADGDRLAYLVMELVDGRPLDRVLAADGAFPPARALGLLAEALDALHAAHRRGIVHRDVKPSNLMLRADGRVTVTDFGIARSMAGTRLTASHAVIGTALYMAPEQAEGKAVTPAVDLYAIGVVCYELLVGRPPFTGGGMLEVALKHLREPAPELPGDIPAAVRAFVATALAKDPGERFADAAAMADAARAAAGGEGPPVLPVLPASAVAEPAAAEPVPTDPPAVEAAAAEPVAAVAPVASTEPAGRTRRRGFLVPVVLPIVISVGTATALLVDRGPFTSQAQEPGSPPAVTVTMTAWPAGASPTGGQPPAPSPSPTSPAVPTVPGAQSGVPTGAAAPVAPTGKPTPSPTAPPSTSASRPGGSPSSAPGASQAPQQTAAQTQPPAPAAPSAAPATAPQATASPPATAPGGAPASGCGGTNWGYITNVGDGLRMGLSQDSLTGGQAVVMGGATAYGWVHTVPSSWHQFNPCKLSAPVLVQEMDGRVALSNGFSFLTNWTVTAATVPGAFYLKDYMGQNCLTDNGVGAQLTMTACTPGNKSQEFRIP
ncbi:serine/threonine protein kinase [Streptomyces sp. TLI_053]|uniref:protein kinase domain-containing protein n=1 Tax=Streptomyces sp. TLI_053 TaxID=1855352 RepID=UPI00087D6B84|nr:serine/threonine-protein kinase [Streptomyces sp. TLI_053]SDT72371.1 serine/threonine protein kinase [Streptomyces sp. TLI_053]